MNALDRARQLAIAAGREARCGRYPAGHGVPVHIGEPELLCIHALARPVFRACGVILQAAVMISGVPFAIPRSSGPMFITDVLDSTYHV